MVALLKRFGESLREGELLPRASTLNQKTTHGFQPHPHIVVCPSFLFSSVIRIVNVVFSFLAALLIQNGRFIQEGEWCREVILCSPGIQPQRETFVLTTSSDVGFVFLKMTT